MTVGWTSGQNIGQREVDWIYCRTSIAYTIHTGSEEIPYRAILSTNRA